MQQAISGNMMIGLLLAYKLAMDVTYIQYIHEYLNWERLYDVNLDIDEYLLAWLVCACVLIIFKSTLQKPLNLYRFSECTLFVLVILVVLPGIAMCGAGAFSQEYTRLYYFYWIWFFLLARLFMTLNIHDLPMVGRLSSIAKKRILFFLCIVFVGSVMTVFFYYGEGRFYFDSLQSHALYSFRLFFRKISMSVFLQYIIANASIFFLFLLMYCFKERWYLGACFILLVQYMNFSCGADKVVALTTLIGVGVYATKRFLTGPKMICFAIGILIFAMVAWDVYSNVFLLNSFRRVFFEPSVIGCFYRSYFQSHATIFDSLLGNGTIDRSIIPFEIGRLYYSDIENHANNGFIGDAFMMFGECGVIFGPVLYCLYFCILDKVSENIDWWIKLGMAVYWAMKMVNSSFSTNMLSHGGILMAVMAYLYVVKGRDRLLKLEMET